MADQSTTPPKPAAFPEPGNCEQERFDAWAACGITARHLKPRTTGPSKWLERVELLRGMLGTGFTAAIIGNVRGTGKTQMGAEVMRHHVEKSPFFSGMYVLAFDIFLTIRGAYNKSSTETELDVIESYIRPQLLIIDEIHERSESNFENRSLTHIIDKRYGHMKDTIFIGNHGEHELQASVGTSIYSRLTETGGVINCNWESFRK